MARMMKRMALGWVAHMVSHFIVNLCRRIARIVWQYTQTKTKSQYARATHFGVFPQAVSCWWH
jgi:hypothetical protein